MAKTKAVRGTKNGNLHAAKGAKNDEFYTQQSDIQAELKEYEKLGVFKDKIVLCNCDVPFESEFFHYFYEFFEQLGLRGMIAVGYALSHITNKRIKSIPPYRAIRIMRDTYKYINRNDLPAMETYLSLPDIAIELKGNGNYLPGDLFPEVLEPGDLPGDFRSDECIELLKEADIVVSNPPFSLFREYVAQLVEYDKKFVIIGSKNAITYKEIFKLIRENRLWLGYGFRGGNAYFSIPEEHKGSYSDGVYDAKTGLVKFRNVDWFTNIDIPKRHEELPLYATYSPDKYPKYDNYDVIEVSKVKEIPKDYSGVMGVPISFLNVHNPGQFELLGIANSARWIDYKCVTKLNGRNIYNRLMIINRKGTSENY